MSGRGGSARSDYVQARLDAILSGAGPASDRPPVEGATVLSARRRLPIPVLAEAMGPPRRSRPGGRGQQAQTATGTGEGVGGAAVAPGRPAPVDAPVRPHPPEPWPGADDPTVPLEAVPVGPVPTGSATDASRSGSTRFDPDPTREAGPGSVPPLPWTSRAGSSSAGGTPSRSSLRDAVAVRLRSELLPSSGTAGDVGWADAAATEPTWSERESVGNAPPGRVSAGAAAPDQAPYDPAPPDQAADDLPPPDQAADDPDWFDRLLAEPAGSGSTGSRPTARAGRSGSQPRPDGSRTGAAQPQGERPPGDRSGHSAHPVDGRSEPEDERAVRITIPRLTRRHLVVLATVLALAVAFSAFLLLRARADPVPVVTATPVAPEGQQGGGPVPSEPAPTPTPTPVPVLVVHVLGAVAEPGVVELPEGARVADALEAAGGLEERAEPGALNLAQVLQDGQQVHVSEQAEDSEVRGPGDGSAAGGGGGGDAGGSGTGGAGQLLDLNSATAEQLDQLPGVGPVTAEKILAWREEHGRFSRVEELQEVSGIGPKSFAEIAPHVRV